MRRWWLVHSYRIKRKECQKLSLSAKRKYLQGNHSKEYYNVATVLTINLRDQQSNFCEFGSIMLDTSEFPWKLPIHIYIVYEYIRIRADPFGRAFKGVSLRPFAFSNFGFDSRQVHGCFSLVSVTCCLEELSASGWSSVQRSPTDYGVSECDRETSKISKRCPTRGVAPWKKKYKFILDIN